MDFYSRPWAPGWDLRAGRGRHSLEHRRSVSIVRFFSLPFLFEGKLYDRFNSLLSPHVEHDRRSELCLSSGVLFACTPMNEKGEWVLATFYRVRLALDDPGPAINQNSEVIPVPTVIQIRIFFASLRARFEFRC